MLTMPPKRARRAAWATGLAITVGAACVPLLWPMAVVGAVVAGAALWRAREVREQAALQAMMLHPNTPSAQIAAVAGRSPDNDAVLRDVLTP